MSDYISRYIFCAYAYRCREMEKHFKKDKAEEDNNERN